MKEENYQLVKHRVSIVTPVFNGESYLAEFLDSVLAQSYEQVEMILVDDGSADKTVSVAEGYREQFSARGYEYRIIQAGHRNASAAINQGLRYVSGEYLIWPDGDDILEKDSIKKRVEFLQDHPEYHCVRSLAYYRDHTGRVEKRDEKTGDLSKEDLFWDILEFKTYICCGCYMLQTGKFFEIYPKRRIPEYEVGQNFQMLLPFLYRHGCPTIREELYGVRVREGSHSRRKLTQREEEKKYHDYERLVDEIADICHITDPKLRKRIEGWKAGRRFQVSYKYGKLKQAACAVWDLCKCGPLKLFPIIRNTAWAPLLSKIIKNVELQLYRKRKRRRLKNSDFTILASDCNGTFMYYDLGLPFLSPTINLTIGMEDFVKMLENLEWYMEQEVVPLKGDFSCPAGLLGDVQINFIHYETFDQGVSKWEERKKRIRWDNLFIVGSEKEGCTYEVVKRFDRLPYRNKVILTHREYPEFPSAYYIKGFEEKGEMGTTTNFKDRFWRRRYLDDFDYVSFLNRSQK